MEKQKQPNIQENRIVTIPNILSLFRICLIPFIVCLYFVEQSYFAAGCVLLLSGLTDIVDGFIARKFNMISNLGKVLDPIADKLTQAVMLVCLTVRFPWMLLPLAMMICKELSMMITGAWVIRRTGFVPGAVWHGKIATVLLYAMMFLHIFWSEIPTSLSTILIVVSTMMIGLSFVLYLIRNTRILRRSRDKQ